MQLKKPGVLKQSSTLFLKTVVVFVGISVFIAMIWEPQFEGRNVNADLISIYFKDPFLAYAYLASVPFFIALYQGFKLLGYIEKNKTFTAVSVSALRNIKYCALTLVAFIIGAEAYFFIAQRGKEDIAGGVALGLFMILISVIVASVAAVFEKLLQNAVEIRSENDLTI